MSQDAENCAIFERYLTGKTKDLLGVVALSISLHEALRSISCHR